MNTTVCKSPTVNLAESVRRLDELCSVMVDFTYDDLVALGLSQAVSEDPLAVRIESGLEARAWAAYGARERTWRRKRHGWRIWRYATSLPLRARQATLVRWALNWIKDCKSSSSGTPRSWGAARNDGRFFSSESRPFHPHYWP